MEKLTDAEVKKALECCVNDGGKDDCMVCPNFNDFINCKEDLSACALDLINRKDAETFNLKEEVKHFQLKNSELFKLNNSLVKENDYRKAEIERLQKRVKGQKHALFEQQAYTAKLQEEIERYKANEKFINEKCDSLLEKSKKIPYALKMDIARAKSEAYKELAEKFQQEIQESKYRFNDSPYARACNQVADWCIELSDNLLKELAEANK